MRQTARRLQAGLVLTVVVGLTVIGVSAQGIYNDYGTSPQFRSRHTRSILQNFAVDRMLKDKGFVRSIINCVLDKGPCETNGRKLRLMAPEILRGQCPGCSRTVHNQIRKVISHVQRNFPVEWSEVTRRFMSYSTGGQSYAPPQPAFAPVQPPPPPAYNNPPQLPPTYNNQDYNPGAQPPQVYNPAAVHSPPAYNSPAQQQPQAYNPNPVVQQQVPAYSPAQSQQQQQAYNPAQQPQSSFNQPQQSQPPPQSYDPNNDPNLYQNYG